MGTVQREEGDGGVGCIGWQDAARVHACTKREKEAGGPFVQTLRRRFCACLLKNACLLAMISVPCAERVALPLHELALTDGLERWLEMAFWEL